MRSPEQYKQQGEKLAEKQRKLQQEIIKSHKNKSPKGKDKPSGG